MPAWLSLILWNVVIPDIILWLRHTGYTNAAETLAATAVTDVVKTVKSIKTYDQYPGDPPTPTGTTNMTTGDGSPVT